MNGVKKPILGIIKVSLDARVANILFLQQFEVHYN